jgi:hypothetical protein
MYNSLLPSKMEARGHLHAAVALPTAEEPLIKLEIESNADKYMCTKIHNRRACGCLGKSV